MSEELRIYALKGLFVALIAGWLLGFASGFLVHLGCFCDNRALTADEDESKDEKKGL